MESFLTRPESIKIRIRRNQRRAMSVGVFYWVGILLLLCFSIFPYVSRLNGFKEQNGELWIITFMKPIMALLSAQAMTSDLLMPAVVSILYIASVAVSLICAIVATTRLFRVTKRNPTNKWGYNRAARAMKVMGKCFALMFFMMFAVTALGVSLLDGRPTLFFYLAFAVALVFHFVGNFRGCKVSFFQMTEDRFNPIEKQRTLTRKVSLARNTWQMICIWLVILLTDRFGNSAKFFEILDGKQLSLIDGIVLPAFMLVILGCLLVAIGHATSTAEYSEFGEKARGMKNCRNCAVVIGALGFVGMLLAVFTSAVDKTSVLCLIGVFFVGLQWFFAEQMFASFATKQEEIIANSPEAEKTPVREKKSKKGKKAKAEAQKITEETQPSEGVQPSEEPQPEVNEDIMGEDISEVAEKVLDEVKPDEILYSERVEEDAPVGAPVEEKKIEEEKATQEEVAEPKCQCVHHDPTYFVPNFLQTPNIEEEEALKKKKEEEVSFESLTFDTPSEESVEALRERWLGSKSESETKDRAPDTRLLSAQQVHCPGCDALLAVRFGLTKAKCSKCGTAFELKKRSSQRYY